MQLILNTRYPAISSFLQFPCIFPAPGSSRIVSDFEPAMPQAYGRPSTRAGVTRRPGPGGFDAGLEKAPQVEMSIQ